MEPFFRLQIGLYEPAHRRSEILTVTSADTVDAYPRLREDAAALDSAARACDAVGRLFETAEPHPGVFALLCNELALLNAGAAHATHANQLAFRLKLLLAAGLAPQLAACASCGEGEHLVAFSGAAGGVVCSACEASGFAIGEEAHAFMTGALGATLANVPAAGERALREADRAISETVEHHANIRLNSAIAQ
jgi:DNA repair protein RecO (recombination protein O)